MSKTTGTFEDTGYSGAAQIDRRRRRSHTLTVIGQTPRVRRGPASKHAATCLARRGATCTCDRSQQQGA